VAGCTTLPVLNAIANRTRSDGVDKNAPAPKKHA
jgi:hypothetical protein